MDLNTCNFMEDLKPGHQVSFCVEIAGELVNFGAAGDIVYRGYQVTGTVAYWVLDYIQGTGKKTKSTRVSVNAGEIKRFRVINAAP